MTQRLIWNALRLIRRQNHTSIFQNADDLCDSITRNITNHNRTFLIPGSGVDIRRYTNTEFEEEDIVALPARLIWPKGIREFVEAATIVKQTIPSARMVLVGDPDSGNPQSCSKNWIRERQAQGLIEWWGHCPDMRQVYRQAQIVALPTWYGEGVPKVLLEAAACGRPLVATDTRGCRDIVRHGETGYCVPPRDPRQLADAILSLLADRRKREQMGHAGRQLVVAQFRDTDVARKTVAVYQQSIAEHACPQKPKDASSKLPIPIAQEVFS
jgi:glycosyltransferase involved in cell wall biosynthesis